MRDDTIPVPGAADRAVAYGDLTDDLLRTDWWTDAMLARADIPVVDIPFVSIGGGIGSFVTVDYLRICGVPTSAIRVFTQLDTPWESYEYLTRVSQIPRGERLRSDSASCPDNIWGFPSYALREAMATRSLEAAGARARRAALRRLLDAQGGAGVRRRWSRSTTGSATRRWWSRARSAWCAGGWAAATSRSSPRPRAPPAPSAWRSAAGTCTSPSATPG